MPPWLLWKAVYISPKSQVEHNPLERSLCLLDRDEFENQNYLSGHKNNVKLIFIVCEDCDQNVFLKLMFLSHLFSK
jgi:hypothetical protein